MQKNEIDYIIHPMSEVEFKVHKFLCGTLQQTYKVMYEHNIPYCSCPSGIYLGYCKHKDWVHAVKHKEVLPVDVSVAEEVTQQGLEELFDMIKEK